jgi:hypothetical protein|tara:strand:+ start:1250 stop:1837 length:588 start_codon:yes stop_codon:yes gene_type:complete
MKKFSENFYTDDFDQEMLDFIEENYNVDTVNGWYVKRCLSYHFYDNDFYVSEYLGHGVYLTKQQFKEKIGMTNKDTFTKDDLVAGKHVVECRNGSRYVVLEDNVLLELGDLGWEGLDDFEEDLLFGRDNSDEWDIVKVYRVQYKNIHLRKDLPLVWERKEKSEEPVKSEAQLQYEECQAKMDELQKELSALKEKL